MLINLSKYFLQIQSFFFVSNKKQLIFLLGKTGSRERKSLNFKRPSKTLRQDKNAISNYIYIFCTTLSSVSIHHFYTNYFPVIGTLGLQCILRTQLIIHTTHLPSCFPYHYVTSLLAYCKG